MARTIEFKIDDGEGVETTYSLPARFVTCKRCEGEGTHLNPSIGSHAYTQEEFEQFDDEEREAYFTRGGMWDVQCERCQGKRVVLIVNRSACLTTEQVEALALYDEVGKDAREFEALWRNEQRMQAMMGGVEF